MSENKKFGKYTLMRHLATGGMAEIWLAEQRGPGGFNKELVIKRILPHLAEEGDMTQMFLDEARIVAYLTHPNIGQVFELGEHDGDYFIAMEFIDGLDLVEVRNNAEERGRKLPVPYAARIICDVLQALDYAHNFVDRQGNHVKLIHRDISPHNVLISNDGVVKLVDFGVAKAAMNTHKTETGAVKGKFAYMAPEQIENDDLDHRVDLFAVGAVFFELLTGEKPFGDDLKAVSKIISEDAPDPRTLRSEIPEEVARIILKALSRDREKRFSTAAEMERQIELYLRTTEEVVGTRELSVMVHQLRGISRQKPTEQLFGFEKQGVDRQEPRVTVKEPGDRTGQLFGVQGQEKKEESTDSAPLTAKETPVSKRGRKTQALGSDTDSLDVSPEPRDISLGLAIGFIFLVFAISVAVVAIGFLMLSNDEPGDAVAAEVTDSGAEMSWRHGEDALIVFLDSDEPAEIYYDGEFVGATPFQTYLDVGDYSIELHHDGDEREVEFEVEPERAVQSFRFD